MAVILTSLSPLLQLPRSSGAQISDGNNDSNSRNNYSLHVSDAYHVFGAVLYLNLIITAPPCSRHYHLPILQMRKLLSK